MFECAGEEPLRRITLVDRRWGEESTTLDALIREDGTLVIENVEMGPRVEQEMGDFDHESWTYLKPEYRDTLLLRLLAERFTRHAEIREYLDAHRIAYEYDSWT